MKDLRKNWTRDISLCIKLLKCKLIQILKRSLNLRDCFSHFVLKNWYYRCLYFFLLLLFYPWATPQVPTVDQLKKNCFSLCEKTISQMSLYLPFTAISYKRLVTGSGKKNQLFGKTDNLLTHFEWANADEKILMFLLKEVSVIVARRMLFKRNTFRCQLPQCKKKETNTEQCRQQSSKLTDRELSSISYTIMYMFARGLSFVFFSHLNN